MNDNRFKLYVKPAEQPMRPYEPGEDLTGITVSESNVPELGGMIAKNPKNEKDLWYVPKQFFEGNYVAVPNGVQGKTLHNSTVSGAKKNISDLQVFGNGDTFKLICKASSKQEGWMKSTKAMQIDGVGCIVQVTTQQGDNVSEALTFVPGVKIDLIDGDKDNGRKLAVDYAPSLFNDDTKPPIGTKP